MSDGRLIFDTELDASGVEKGVKKSKETISKSLNEIAKENNKTVNQIRSDVMKAAAQYEREGLSKSEAIKKAYADIGYSAGAMSEEIEKSAIKMGSAFEQTGAKLTKFITKPALLAAGAIAGISLVKGFNRLKNIDTAKAQLEGLGHSAKEVDNIMDSAMKSVKGTAYGFDEAATAAASAVAAGIKPGQQLTRYLGLVGDAAAQSKLSFTEMGSIFNKVMASGKISMEEVNQLADQGIPIYKMLSEQLGVTQADVRDMVSQGKIDSETFLAAIENNIGGAAKVMGEKSFVGAVANIGASLGRIGANFLDAGGKGGGFFSQLKPLMVELMEKMEGIEDKAAGAGEKFGAIFKKAVEIIRAVPGPILGIGAAMTLSAGPTLSLTGKIISGVGALNKFRDASGGATAKLGVLSGKLTMSEAIFGSVGKKMSSATMKTASFVKAKTISTATTVKDTVAQGLNAVATSKVGTAAKSSAVKVLAFASAHKVAMFAALGVVGVIAALAVGLAKFDGDADAMAAAITGFANKAALAISKFAEAFPGMIDGFVAAFTQIINSLVAMLPTLIPLLINAGIQLFMALVESLKDIIQPLVDTLPQIITAIVNAIPVLIPALIQAGITLFTALIDAIPIIIPALKEALPQIIIAIVNGLITLLGAIRAVGITILQKLWEGIQSKIAWLGSKVVAFAKGIPGKIRAGLGSLWSIGSDFIAGLWNGISSKKDWLINRVKDLAGLLPKAIKKILKIASPSKVMAVIGKWIPLGLVEGIVGETRQVVAVVRGQVDAIRSAYSTDSPRINSGMVNPITSSYKARFAAATGGGTQTVNEGTVVNQTVNINQPVSTPTETARAIRKQAMFGLAGA